jgi:hypothetical protein
MIRSAASILLATLVATSAIAASIDPEPDSKPTEVPVVNTYVAQPHQTPLSFANTFGPEHDPVPTGPNEFGPEPDPPGSNDHGTKPVVR